MYAIGYYYLHLRHSLTSLCVSQEANLEVVVKSLKTGLIRVGTISHVLWIVALQNTVSNETKERRDLPQLVPCLIKPLPIYLMPWALVRIG